MAKKESVNKSAAIRAYLTKSRAARPKEVKAALAKKGVEVSEALVSKVMHNAATGKKRTATKKPEQKPGSRKRKVARDNAAATEPLEDVKHAGDLMLQAVELVMKAGAKEAKQLVNIAADMVKRIRD